jgi:iron complex outermembrane receptor protein
MLRQTFHIGSVTGILLIALLGMEAARAQTPQQSGFELEEVIVTARKREEGLQETPVAVSVFTSDELKFRQIQSTDDLEQVTPNLTFVSAAPGSGSSSTSQIFIRGIGQVDFTGVTDPGVGLYVDGVYYARSVGGTMPLLDLDRVEVLRGPQGTLFGRNTMGGAVVLHTKKPSETFGGSLEFETGSDDKMFVTGIVNMPISDTLRTKAVLSRRDRDGYVERIPDGKDLGDDDKWGARLSALWTPSDRLEGYFTADFSRERENGAPGVSVGINDLMLLAGLANILDPECPLPPGPPVGRSTLGDPRCANDTAFIGEHKTGGTFLTKSDLDFWGLSGTLTWEAADWLTVKSITSYRDMSLDASRDGDDTDFDIWGAQDTFDNDQFSQELQFTGRALQDRLNWLLGIYYFEETTDNANLIFPQIGAIRSGGISDNDSKAAFTQATYSVTERLAVTAGLRWTEDQKRFTPDQFFLSAADPAVAAFFGLPPNTALTAAGIFPVGHRILPKEQFKLSFSDWTPMVNVAYRWTEELMTYFTWSEGYKSGGFDQRMAVPPTDPITGTLTNTPSTFEPETASAFELGLKTDIFDDRMRLNAAVFHTEYEDIQLIVRETINAITFNGGTGTLTGFEVETTLVPTPNVLITGAVGYIDASYDQLDPLVIANGVLPGHDFVNTPEWTGNMGAAYAIRMPQRGTLTPRISWSYRSGSYKDAINSPQLYQDAYHLLNVSLTFDSDDGHWQGVIGGTNIGDEKYLFTGNCPYQTAAAYCQGYFSRGAEWFLSIKYGF